MGRGEFIAIAAALMAVNALAIDIMLPAMQQIGAALGVEDENQRQLVITAYVVGFGAAQLIFGPIADRFGRRGPLLIGLGIYVVAAVLAAFAPSFWMLLLMRALQGVGAAATRVIAVSMVRDRFGGRQMAEVMSLVMMVFMIVPVIAPGAGQVLLLVADWQMIFIFMGVVAAGITLWFFVRMPETLAEENRRAFNPRTILDGFRIVLGNRLAFCYALATALIFGGLFGFINSAQQIFIDVYALGAWFPVLFAVLASMMAISSFLNSRLVGRFGMRGLSHFALFGYIAATTIWIVWALIAPMPLFAFVGLFGAAMFMFGWIGPNFNALAMEPLGHVAGTASSVLGFLQTLGGGLIGAYIGLSFDGTVVPLAIGYFLSGFGGLALVLIAENGRLFQARHQPTAR
ncbi:MAG: multidrug effflux MFS transporter [Mesorhizobium sp.]|nr:multidrug effflux MFS transporter [Mesorhizobium sp.]